MHYNYFRSYSAERGRYTQADPIGLGGGFNRFGYVEGNALGSVDPTGLTTMAWCFGGPVPCAFGVGSTVAAIGSGMWSSGQNMPVPSRPRDLSPKESRYYDRHCAGESDPCTKLKTAVNQTIVQARTKINNVWNDNPVNGLFKNAFSTPNPAITGANTTWMGHVDDLDGRRASIWVMIELGRKLGCDMSTEKAAAMTLLTPGAPR